MKTVLKTFFLLSVSVMVLLWQSCSNGSKSVEWPNYKGPNLNGIVNEIDWDVNELDTSNIIWQTNVGYGHAELIIADGKCFVSGWVKDTVAKDSITTMYCFNAKTGDEIWKKEFKKGWVHWEGPRSTPSYDDGKLYNLFWDGQMVCFNAKNGDIIWERNIAADSVGKANRRWGFSTAPVVYNDLLLFNIGKTGLALNKTDGSIVWSSANKGFTFCSPTIFNFQGADAGVFTCDSTISIVELKTGNVLRQYLVENSFITVDPIVVENYLYLYDRLYDLDDEGELPVWSNDSIRLMFTNGLVIDKKAYAIEQVGRRKTALFCMDILNGKMLWSTPLNKWGSLVSSNGKLIINEGDGMISVANVSPEKYDEIKRIHMLDKGTKRNGFCWTTPTIIDGKLYLRNFGGDIACVDVSTK